MRLLLLAATASLVGGGAFGQSLLGHSDPGGGQAIPTVHVAAPPAIMAAPPAPVVPASSSARVLAPPPGLVETPLPPPNMVQQAALPPDNAGSARPLRPQTARPVSETVPTQAVSPAAPAATVAPSTGSQPAQVAQSVSGSPAPGPSMPSAAVPAALPANDVAPTPDRKWVSGRTVELGVLNKVDGSTKTLTIPVGGQAVAGDLTVSVQACVVHPADTLPDTAVFLTLQPTDASSTNSPIYRGWIVKSLPGSATAENEDEIFRVIQCL